MYIQTLDKKLPILFSLLIILLMGLLSLTWFRGEFLINPGDTNFSFNPTHDLYRAFFIWDSQQGLGTLDSMSIARIFPYYLSMAALQKFGVSLYSSQKVLFYWLLTASGVFAFLLIYNLLSNHSYQRIAALFGANCYMMNPYLIWLRWGSGYIMGLFSYVVLPFLVLMWIRGSRKTDIRYGIGMILGCLFALPSLTNPAILAPLLLVCIVDIVFLVALRENKKPTVIALAKYIIICGLIFIAVFSFWILGIMVIFRGGLKSLSMSTDIFHQEIITSLASSILNLLRHLGDIGIFSNYGGELYYRFSPAYLTPHFIFISFFILVLPFLPLLFLRTLSKETREFILYFTILFLIGLLLSKGAHDPFGNLFIWAIKNVPLAKAFRSAYEKFGNILLLSAAVLSAYSLSIIMSFFRSYKSHTAVCLGLFTILNLYAFPFWTGEIWRNEGPIMPGFRFKIPDYYYAFKTYLNTHAIGPYRILQLPPNNVLLPGIITLQLGSKKYGGSDPLARLLKTSMVYLDSFAYSISDNVRNELFRHCYPPSPHCEETLKKIAPILNVKYILLRGDMSNVTYPEILSPKSFSSIMSNFPIERSFGPLDLHQVSEMDVNPIIYGVSSPFFHK